jgi:hypothetical protein
MTQTFWFATEGPSLTRQEFAEKCDIDVLMAYGRCLRPALYSSLRSETLGAFASQPPKSWRLFRNEKATSRPVRAGAIGGSTAMTRTAFCRKSPRVPRVCWLGSWALGTSDRGGQDKNRKVRTVGSVRNSTKFQTYSTHCEHLTQLAFFDNTLSAFGFCHLKGRS